MNDETKEPKTYIMTCEDCRKFQQEMINADRANFVNEVKDIFKNELQTHVETQKTLNQHSNQIFYLFIFCLFIITIVLFSYNNLKHEKSNQNSVDYFPGKSNARVSVFR